MTDVEATRQTDGLIECHQCHNEVPRLEYCIRCGDPLSDEYSAEGRSEQRRRFAAAPDERVAAVALVSTLFPQLPRAEMRLFRTALLIGSAIIVGLTLTGFYPVALGTSAVLVPLLMVMYVYVVDIYEDEPLRVIGATMVWGAAAGVVYALATRALESGATFGASDLGDVLLNGVGLPLVEMLLMIAGPLMLLRWKRFNDVLDGVTFGAASAVSFSGAHLIVQSLPVLSAGLRPAGDPLPWIVQLISLGVLQPVIAAGAIGAAAAAFWLRYNTPPTDRHALGAAGVPAIALLGAGALIVAAGLAKALLPLIAATVILAVVAAIALLWLRATIHLGLIQESREIKVTGSIVCPNCGHTTPEHTFCGHCGVSLRALPRSRRDQ